MRADAESDCGHHGDNHRAHRKPNCCGACEVAGPAGSEVVAEWDAVRIVGIVLNSPQQIVSAMRTRSLATNRAAYLRMPSLPITSR